MHIIDIIKYFVLGLVQGIAEILPISSSGHLALLQQLFAVNPDNEAGFAIFVHFASLVALVIFFHKIIWQIIKGFVLFIFKKASEHKQDFWMGIYIIVASIPAALVGFLLEDRIDAIFSNLMVVGLGFLFTATLLFLWPKFGKKTTGQLTIKHAIVTGLFQAIGIIPGVSRSGITITGAKISGLEEKSAKQFAFLLFVPIALGSFVVSLFDINTLSGVQGATLGYYLIAMAASFIFTMLALLFIFKKFQFKHAKYFGIYLVAIGLFTLFVASMGA